jgi:uncharacterized protein (DUF4415 family)
MKVTSVLKKNDKPTGAQLKRIREASKRPPAFDEDCPESTPEQLAQFAAAARQRNIKHTVGLRLPQKTIDQYKTFGKGYTSVMASVLEYAIQNPDLIKEAL